MLRYLALLPLTFLQSGPSGPVDLTFLPDRPVQGGVMTIFAQPVGADSLVGIRGRFAGESLHFERDGEAFRAIAGVPVTDSGEVTFPLVLHHAGGSTSRITATVRVSSADYGADTLRVSSTFSDPLTPEQRERVRREREQSRNLTPLAHETPRLWRRSFLRPKRGPVTSSYGRARVFNGAVRSRHMGVDIDGVTGQPVRAANDGVVALVGDFFYSGNIVYVNHGAGLITAYLHLSRTAVVAGDTVTRGQVVGYVGQTGRVTGPHLHWAARYGDVSINALSLLDLDPPDSDAATP